MSGKAVWGIERELGCALVGPDGRTVDQTSDDAILLAACVIRAIAMTEKSKWAWWWENGEEPQEIEPLKALIRGIATSRGGRMYVDHGHPELSSPECSTLKELVAHLKAERLVVARGATLLNAILALTGHRVALHENNSDGKGSSYGCHENYLAPVPPEHAKEPYSYLTKHVGPALVPFLVVRQLLVGAGKSVVETPVQAERCDGQQFQLSSRAEFFEKVSGPDTTSKRPIFNTRMEPHADPGRFMRVHVIVGDANFGDYSTATKVALTAAMLELFSQGRLPRFSLADPVSALHAVARDLTFSEPLDMLDGSTMTATELLGEYVDAALAAARSGELACLEPEESLPVFNTARDALDSLAAGNWEHLAGTYDWATKRMVLEHLGLPWGDDLLYAHDLAFHRIGPTGTGSMLERRGLLSRMVDDRAVTDAMEEPPSTTRAAWRGLAVNRFGEELAGVEWRAVRIQHADRTFSIYNQEPTKVEAVLLQALAESRSTREFSERWWNRNGGPPDPPPVATPAAELNLPL